MTAALRAEWRKVSTLASSWVLVSIALAFPLVIVTITTAVADDLFDGADLAELTAGTALVSALLLGTLGVLAITGELASNTIRPTFAALPDRWRALLAKPILQITITLAVMITVVVVAWVVGAGLGTGSQELGDESATSVLVGIVLLAVLLSLFGYALGLLVRNSALAVCILLLWPLVVEGIIAGLLAVANQEGLQRWLPYQAGFQLISNDRHVDDTLGSVRGGLWFGLWVVVLLGLGLWRTHRRDA